MPRINIKPSDAMAEFASMNANLRTGAGNLVAARNAIPGCSARDEVYRLDDVILYRYRATTGISNTVPLLIVYALVNRPDMADLEEGRSLIRSLLDQGLDVYLIDWGYPDGADRARGLGDYINRYLDSCVEVVREASGQKKINLLGICQGGTFSLCYTALYPEKVRNLIPTVTPVDFHTADDRLSHLFRYVDVDRLVDSMGNIPGDFLNTVFLLLKPFTLTQQKYVHLIDGLNDEDATKTFMRMEKWIFDSPALAGTAFREFATRFYHENALVKGNLEIDGEAIRLKRIDMPVLNIYARDDHLVPPASSKALGDLVGTKDYQAFEFPGGHIGIYVSSRASAMVELIAQWLGAR